MNNRVSLSLVAGKATDSLLGHFKSYEWISTADGVLGGIGRKT